MWKADEPPARAAEHTLHSGRHYYAADDGAQHDRGPLYKAAALFGLQRQKLGDVVDHLLAVAHKEEISKELAKLKETYNSMKARWENEKKDIAKVQSLREKIDQVNAEIQTAEHSYDLARLSKLKYGDLPELTRQLHEQEQRINNRGDSLLRDKVTDEEIARIISRWTGIPVSKLETSEKQKLLQLPEIMHKRVIGQDDAVTKVCDAILRSRAGIIDPNRPIGSFMFLGPTGVGKTELAKTLAENLFDDQRNMVRIDMSEYMEKYSVSRLIGAPPGYVGYEEGGQLTEAVRRKPYSVILFDEIEKAHPDVFNVLLQILDDGRVTDSQGRTVDFKNTIIILTSNLGSSIILDSIEKEGKLTAEAEEEVHQLLKHQFRPEFLNRLDEIILFKPLTKEEIAKIVDLLIAALQHRLSDKQLKLNVTDSARKFIAEGGYDPVYGARPLKRFVQHNVETLIARKILQSDLAPDTTLTVDVKDGELVVE